MSKKPTALGRAGALVVQVVIGLPLLAVLWLFASLLKLRAWMKGY